MYFQIKPSGVGSGRTGGVGQRRAMIWQQGYVELAVSIDEWVTRYMVVNETEDEGLTIFADAQARRRGAPERVVPISSIKHATRAIGPLYFEWGLVRLNPIAATSCPPP